MYTSQESLSCNVAEDRFLVLTFNLKQISNCTSKQREESDQQLRILMQKWIAKSIINSELKKRFNFVNRGEIKMRK